MSFEAPAVLAALLLLPVTVLVARSMGQRAPRYPVLYPNVGVLRSVAAPVPRHRRVLPPALLLAALALSILGAARPHAAVRVPKEEATVVLALDRSGSMRATDVTPTRMTAAKEAARTFLSVLPPTFRVGVVAFDEVADVLIRPTDDRRAVNQAIDAIEADGGTAMGDAIAQSLSLDPAPGSGEEPLAAVILLSDGYNTAGSVQPLEAARRAAVGELPVYTIALGTDEGVVTVPGPFGSQVQRVPPDPETLSAIAEVTDGEFFEAPSDDDLRSIYERLGSRVGYRTERKEITAAFAGAGALIALGGLYLSVRWGRKLW